MNHVFTNDQKMVLRNNFSFTVNELERLEALDLEIEDIYNDVRHTLTAYDRVSINHGILTDLLEQGYTFEEIEDLIERGLIDEDFERILGITSFEQPNDLYTYITQMFDNGNTIEDVQNSINELQDEDVVEVEPYEERPSQGGKRRKQNKTRRRKQNKTKKRKQNKTKRRKQNKSRRRK
jgi:hypothetical protein